MEDYGNNSIKATEQASKETKNAPVTTNVIVKDNNRFLKKIFANDAKSTASTITNEVVIPGTKNLIVNILKRTIDFLFNGTSAPAANNRFSYYDVWSSQNPNRVSYGQSVFGIQQPSTMNNGMTVAQRSSIFSASNIVFPDRGPAEEVLARMREIISRYGMVSILDFNELIGQKTSVQQNKYGWKDLSMATVSSVAEGYIINFPRVVPLE